MKPYITYLNNTVNKNTELLSKHQGSIKWVNNESSWAMETERNQLIESLKTKVNSSYKNSKLWYKSLSKGCELCAAGEWSCLFVNNICNATCNFCPTGQQSDEIPSSQGSTFYSPKEYADYINYFDFKGVSLSGGEPLLTLPKTIEFIEAIRKYCRPDIYLWMYSNGLLGSKSIFKHLKSLGLDEVRFNLVAGNFDLSVIEKASPYIKNITVEIPAVPEHYEKLVSILPQLVTMGVTNINLHQLRVTPHNVNKMICKGYTFVHGDPVTVAESELTALRLIEYAFENHIQIGINYCNYHYKNNFQKAGYRRKMASKFADVNQEVTEKGYVRTIHGLSGKKSTALTLPNLIKKIDKYEDLKLDYSRFHFGDLMDETHEENKVEIKGKQYQLMEISVASNIEISSKLYLQALEFDTAKAFNLDEMFKVFLYEKIEDGLPEYY